MSVLPPTPGLQTTFDDNNDDLLHLLTEAWENPLKDTIVNSKWTRDYLTKLTSFTLDELLHEPAQLKEEQTKAKRDAQQLAFRDYPSFLQAQTCRHEAEETLDGLDVHLGEFVSSVPELQQACEEFTEKATALKEERNKITSVLDHQHVLTDLLEIPQLMETCVWNGYYSEAMDLASHVRLLQVRYPLSVVKSIQQQVQASSDLMLVQLISHLQKPIRLAAAMNVVGFLRRMDVFQSETELRMVFLRCRHDFLQQRLTRVKRDISDDARQKSQDAFEYLKRFIDVMREQMFEIGTQYISIFSNEQGTLLSDYMVTIAGLIKSTLHTYLPMIEDTSALASLLTQLQYCGMSLGRIGLDFRHILVYSFEEAVQPMILRWIDASTEDLVNIIVTSTEQIAAPSTWMSSKLVSQSSETEVKRYAFQPPMLLVAYPSLAIFTNGILSAFNALRLLPAVSLYEPIQNHLEACFMEIGNALKQYSDQATAHIPDEVTFLQSYSAAYARCCVPYLKSCLVDGIYGNLSIPSTTSADLEILLADHLPVVTKEVEEEVAVPVEQPSVIENEITPEEKENVVDEKENMDLITPNVDNNSEINILGIQSNVPGEKLTETVEEMEEKEQKVIETKETDNHENQVETENNEESVQKTVFLEKEQEEEKVQDDMPEKEQTLQDDIPSKEQVQDAIPAKEPSATIKEASPNNQPTIPASEPLDKEENISLEPSTAEHTDEEHKEDEGATIEPEKKQPSKKPKKHKGKKGRR